MKDKVTIFDLKLIKIQFHQLKTTVMFIFAIEEGMEFVQWTLGVFYYLSISLALVPFFLWVYKELTMGICKCKSSMHGKVILITGGSNGIGLETAVDLAKRGGKLIIGCRTIHNVAYKIQKRVPDAFVDVIRLDLSSKSSIRQFAEEVISKYEAIHVLINNAGMINSVDGPIERKETEDGFELVMATNYLGHCFLNHLLLDLVKQGGHASNECSRVILVSSIAIFGPEALDLCKMKNDGSYNVNFDLEIEEKDSRRQYSKTKLAQVMYASHLAKILKKETCNTLVACLHPGFVRTDIIDGVPKQAQGIFKIMSYILGKNAWQGAQTSINLAVGKFKYPMEEVNGRFFADCKSNPWFLVFSPDIIKDDLACKAVWNETMGVLGIL